MKQLYVNSDEYKSITPLLHSYALSYNDSLYRKIIFNNEFKGVIYCTVNLINGNIYIGKDSHNNPSYLGSGRILHKAIRKYGKHNFKKFIIDADAYSIDELEIIKKYNT